MDWKNQLWIVYPLTNRPLPAWECRLEFGRPQGQVIMGTPAKQLRPNKTLLAYYKVQHDRSDKTWETPKNGSSKMYLSSFVQPKPTQAFEMLEDCRGTEQRHLVRQVRRWVFTKDLWSVNTSLLERRPKYAAKASRSNRAQELPGQSSPVMSPTTFINNILFHHNLFLLKRHWQTYPVVHAPLERGFGSTRALAHL